MNGDTARELIAGAPLPLEAGTSCIKAQYIATSIPTARSGHQHLGYQIIG